MAAYHLEEQGQSPFSAEALIVASWQRFPRTFGLKGYAEQYPDSNKVLSSIMGEKGLARRGWLAKMGQKLYSLTREGRQVARGLERSGDKPVVASDSSGKLTREQEKYFLSLSNSSAVQKFQEGLKQELNFQDACKFWGISENLHGEAVDARLDRVHVALAEFDRLVRSGDLVLSTGRHVSPADIDLLRKVDDYLSDCFGRHLSLLRNRARRN